MNIIALSQQIIAQQKWIRVYTTNYDDVLETAGEKDGRIYTPMLLSDTVERINCVESVVHMNGYIRNLDKNSLENEFKLCTRSYLQLPAQFPAKAIGIFHLHI